MTIYDFFYPHRISVCEDMDRRCISFVWTNKDILHDTCVKEDRAEHLESQFPKYNFCDQRYGSAYADRNESALVAIVNYSRNRN